MTVFVTAYPWIAEQNPGMMILGSYPGKRHRTKTVAPAGRSVMIIKKPPGTSGKRSAETIRKPAGSSVRSGKKTAGLSQNIFSDIRLIFLKKTFPAFSVFRPAFFQVLSPSFFCRPPGNMSQPDASPRQRLSHPSRILQILFPFLFSSRSCASL